MSLLKVYTGAEIIALFGPVNLLPGRNKDEFLRIERLGENPVTSEVGIDGEVVVSATKDQRCNVILTLMQTSNVNELLSVYQNLAIEAPAMAGAIQPLEIKDPNGVALYFEANAIVAKPPDPTFGEKIGTREWTILCPHLTRNDGGNTPIGG